MRKDDGSGKGKKLNKNTGPCTTGGPGYGKGDGKGRGNGRKDSKK